VADFLLPQLIIGDSGLQLNIRKLVVSGKLIMGTPDCPVTSGEMLDMVLTEALSMAQYCSVQATGLEDVASAVAADQYLHALRQTSTQQPGRKHKAMHLGSQVRRLEHQSAPALEWPIVIAISCEVCYCVCVFVLFLRCGFCCNGCACLWGARHCHNHSWRD
jgi:hypothetical protein